MFFLFLDESICYGYLLECRVEVLVMSTTTDVFMEKWEKYPYLLTEKSILSRAMVIITN